VVKQTKHLPHHFSITFLFQIRPGTIDPCRRCRYVPWKRRHPITPWRSDISQKNGNISYAVLNS